MDAEKVNKRLNSLETFQKIHNEFSKKFQYELAATKARLTKLENRLNKKK
jgi:hypothetical protein